MRFIENLYGKKGFRQALCEATAQQKAKGLRTTSPVLLPFPGGDNKGRWFCRVAVFTRRVQDITASYANLKGGRFYRRWRFA